MNLGKKSYLTSYIFVLVIALLSIAQSSMATEVTGNVILIKSDEGNWGGTSAGSTHQNKPHYQIMKLLNVTEEYLTTSIEARLQVYMGLLDYSATRNGFTEEMEIVINNNVMTIPLKDFFHGMRRGQMPKYQWCDFVIPIKFLKAGTNKIIIRKAPSDTNDDYIYIGIDNTVSNGNSACSMDSGYNWNYEKLNALGSKGEYMVRLVLFKKQIEFEAIINFEDGLFMDDPGNLIRSAKKDNRIINIELNSSKIATFSNVSVSSDQNISDFNISWYDEKGNEIHKGIQASVKRKLPEKVVITPKKAFANQADLHKIIISYQISQIPVLESEKKVNISPIINQPQGTIQAVEPSVSQKDNEVLLKNGYYSVRLSHVPYLQIKEYKSAYVNWENILHEPDATELFWIKINDRKISSRDFEVTNVANLPLPDCGVSIELYLKEFSLQGILKIKVDDSNEMKMSLVFNNTGTGDLRFKTVFPHVGGIIISENEKDDYYLFPAYGGVISNKAAFLNSGYGKTTAWWQMVDLFSPQKGTGIYVRINDPNGIYKSIELAKGKTPIVTFTDVDYRAPDPDISWANQRMLESLPGTAMAFGYQSYRVKPGESFAYPEAIIGVHPGDWHKAMEKYASWAHEVWDWRPYPSTITDAYVMKFGPGNNDEPLIVNGKWRDPKTTLTEQADILELQYWWRWSEVGPWGVPLDDDLKIAREQLGDTFVDRVSYTFVPDPITKRMSYKNNRGDYEYNEAWGGAEALKDFVDELQQDGAVVTLYTDPLLVCGATKFGKAYGYELGVMNPFWDKKNMEGPFYTPLNPEGYVTMYGSWNMCLDNPFYQDFFAETMKRVVRDLGVGIRLDEMGISRSTCYSDKHEHVFAKEPGDEVLFQAEGELFRKVRQAMDEVDPTLILMTEAPGNDFLARYLDGSLVYDTRKYSLLKDFNPVALNLFRFYFPECKVVDYFPAGVDDKFFEQAFWQAKAISEPTTRPSFPDHYYEILKENADAYGSRDITPLVPTLVDYVYANKYATDYKTIIHFYNDSEKTINQALMTVEAESGYHYFDLINLKEVPISKEGNALVIKGTLLPDKAGCIAKLPSLLALCKKGNEQFVEVDSKIIEQREQLTVKVYNKDRNVVYQKTICSSGENMIALPSGEKFSYIKLFQGSHLLDVIGVD